MAISAAEEENIEALKKWWDENGKGLALGLGLAAVGFFGWQFWQEAKIDSAAATSDIYEQLLASVAVAPGTELSSTQRLQAAGYAEELKTDHGDTEYALFGALFAAKLAVEANDLDKAEQELQWLLDNSKDGMFQKTEASLLLTAKLRLGRVILSKGEAQRALDLVNTVDPQNYEAAFSELRGDIYVSQGKKVDALDSYQAASQAGQAGATSPLLQMKIDSLTAADS